MDIYIGDASSLVRCVPGEDATNGFFVSCFVRIGVDGGPRDENIRKRKLSDEDLEEDAQTTRKKPQRKKKKKKPLES